MHHQGSNSMGNGMLPPGTCGLPMDSSQQYGGGMGQHGGTFGTLQW